MDHDDPENDWDGDVVDFTVPSTGETIHMTLPPLPSKEDVFETHKLMFENMVRSSGLTREEFIKRIMD